MNIGSREIVLWMPEPQHQALTRALGEMGTDIETIMQARLEELYSRTVPVTERLRISQEMEAERLEQQRQWEASRTFSVFRIMEHGQDSFLMKEGSVEFLDAAVLLRRYLRQQNNHDADTFVSLIQPAEYIAECRFRDLSNERMENTGRIAGAFDIDLDQGTVYALSILDGWQGFRIRDVAAAAYHATRKMGLKPDDRWRRFLDKLEGKALTPDSEFCLLHGSRELRPEEVGFSNEVTECDGKLIFYIPVNFDPDAVFGTYVATDQNDDYLNVYAQYDLDTDEVQDQLLVILVRSDGTEQEYSYPLSDKEVRWMTEKMNHYCEEQMGLSLSEYSSQWQEENDSTFQPEMAQQ